MALTVHPNITSNEREWIALHGFLRQSGYETRARYQPGWVPSWEKKRLPDVLTCRYEDGEPSQGRRLDAIRVRDNAPVMMKMVRIEADPSPEHARFFAEEPRGSDPRNHCLSLLDVLHPPAYPDSMILISPRCVDWNVWPFARVSEAVDFFIQVFEGIAFMHNNNFVHLDASSGNIVMDGLHLYTEPSHPMRPATVPDGLRPARHIKRFQSQRPVRYYFIDFETSIRFESSNDRHLVQRRLGQDKSVPEEKGPNPAPVDPFALDVYCIGNMIVEHWLKAYRNVEFIRQLAEDMVVEDPAARPTSQQVLERFITIRDSLSPAELDKALDQIPEYHSMELRAKALLPAAKMWKEAQKIAEARRKADRKKARAASERQPVWRRSLKQALSYLSSRTAVASASDSPIPRPISSAAAALHD